MPKFDVEQGRRKENECGKAEEKLHSTLSARLINIHEGVLNR